MRDTELIDVILGAAIEVHRTLGLALLEAMCEQCLAKEFNLGGISFDRQNPIPLVYQGLKIECGYQLDFLVDKRVVLEVKSIEAVARIHESVMLTYLRLSGASIGLRINFIVPTSKDGVRRFVWRYDEKDDAQPRRLAEV